MSDSAAQHQPVVLTPEAAEQFKKIVQDPVIFLELAKAAFKKHGGMTRVGDNGYYRENYAKSLQPIIDEMLVTKQEPIFLFEDFPNYKKRTLLNRIGQSFDYLRRVMDHPDKRYAKLRAEVKLSIEPTGVAIRYRSNDPSEGQPVEQMVAHAASKHAPVDPGKWKQEVIAFIETAEPGESRAWNGLTLNTDEQKLVKEFATPDMFEATVLPDLIILKRL